MRKNDTPITIGFNKELMAIVFACARTVPSLLFNPRLLISIILSIIQNDWNKRMFLLPEAKRMFTSMYSEKTLDIKPFPKGTKIIIANHTYLPGLLSCICRRMPKEEAMPYILTDVSFPHKISLNKKAGFLRRYIANKLKQIELTASFTVPIVPSNSSRKEILASYKNKGRIFTFKEKDLLLKQPLFYNNSFIILIENNPSRGTEINTYDVNFARFTAMLVKSLPKTHIIFLTLNSDSKKVEQRIFKGKFQKYFSETTIVGKTSIAELKDLLGKIYEEELTIESGIKSTTKLF
ncbi:MAG: hypothetical protein PHS44_01420 [Candidatus Dojkabacteria bacterium]|nr:hypothetical protein [Candidatus Dojkabacteria bacterium]